MKIIDKTLDLQLKEQFTSVKTLIENILHQEEVVEGEILLWVPHEVSSLVQLGWEEGLIEDMESFLADIAPSGKWTEHDEPGTPFEKNFYQHVRTKLIGNISMTLIIKDSTVIIGKYQDLYFYSPVYKDIPNQKLVMRIKKYS